MYKSGLPSSYKSRSAVLRKDAACGFALEMYGTIGKKESKNNGKMIVLGTSENRVKKEKSGLKLATSGKEEKYVKIECH